MRDLFQRFTALFRPLATQQNHGPGSVQAAKLNGNVQVQNIRTTHVHVAVHPPDRRAEMARPAAASPARKARPDQAQAFAQYKALTLSERSGLDEMMKREFGTNTILELDEGQINRIMAYMTVCIKNRPAKKTTRRKTTTSMWRPKK